MSNKSKFQKLIDDHNNKMKNDPIYRKQYNDKVAKDNEVYEKKYNSPKRKLARAAMTKYLLTVNKRKQQKPPVTKVQRFMGRFLKQMKSPGANIASRLGGAVGGIFYSKPAGQGSALFGAGSERKD